MGKPEGIFLKGIEEGAIAATCNRRNMMRTMRYVLLTGVLLGVLSTCNMPHEPEADKPADAGNVRVSIQVDQGYPVAERSVFPQVTLDDVDHYALWGAPVESEEAELIPSFTTQGNPSVELTEGVWNFTVKGYKADGALILQGELRDQTISLASYALPFSVAPLREGTGLISVTITLPADSGITTVLVFKDDVEQSPLTVAGNQVTYSAADVAAGDYYYSFRLNNSAGNTLGVVSQIVQVRGRLSSEKTIALTQANLNALPDTPAVPEGFVSISGAMVTGSGSEGVFVSGRTVTVASFAMAKYETTYELWYEVQVWAAANGYTFANQGREGADGTIGAVPTTAKNEPVTYVSWWDVMVWCNAYSEKSGRVPVYTHGGVVIRDSSDTTACDNPLMDKTKSGFRLPTEVEWEFAARGGNPRDTPNWGYTYAGSNTVGDVAWYFGNSGSNTHPVGTKAANSVGLYDMSGNVYEWCWDWYGSVSSSTPTDGATQGSRRVFRGGSWYDFALYAGVSCRSYTIPGLTSSSVGFRVVCPSSS
jgi:formylglycine-generating enzyme required for sulfatase activity